MPGLELEREVLDAESSFEDFFRQKYPSVYAGLLITFRDPQVAEDAAEEAFAKAWLRWGRVRRMDHPRAWVARVAFHYVIEQRSRSKRDREESQAADATEQVPPHDTDVALRVDLESLLGTLSNRQRAVLVLRYYLDMSTKDTAKALRIAEGTVKRHCADALQRLAQRSSPSEPVPRSPE